MTRVEKLDVDGFKGLTDTSLEFGGLNVITGRNNTGKTSVLEAIEIGLAPQRLKDYGNQVDEVVNVYSKECSIQISRPKGKNSFTIEFPPAQEALNNLVDPLIGIVSASSYILNTSKETMVHPAGRDQPELNEAIERSFRKELADIPSEEVPDIGRNHLSISYDGASSYLLNPNELVTQLVAERDIDIEKTLYSEIDFGKLENLSPEDVGFEVVIPDDIATFHPESPQGPNDVLFIEEPRLADPPDISEEEDAAVKKVEIRDYLNDHEITPEPGVTVEDFDFDQIVFEEDGERYQVAYDFMGEGFKTIVGILWQFVGEESVSDVVLMEEPENHMHPGYVGELVPFLVDVAREEDVQLFLTTHNVDFISEFFSELSDERQAYLESEFRLIQMTGTVPKTFDYEAAREQVEDLHLDLRGV